MRVLDVGSGSGYLTVCMCALPRAAFSFSRELARWKRGLKLAWRKTGLLKSSPRLIRASRLSIKNSLSSFCPCRRQAQGRYRHLKTPIVELRANLELIFHRCHLEGGICMGVDLRNHPFARGLPPGRNPCTKSSPVEPCLRRRHVIPSLQWVSAPVGGWRSSCSDAVHPGVLCVPKRCVFQAKRVSFGPCGAETLRFAGR